MSIQPSPARAARILLLLGACAFGGASPAAAVEVGQPAPDFVGENLQTAEVDQFRLSEHLGSVVVIEFFAYW